MKKYKKFKLTVEEKKEFLSTSICLTPKTRVYFKYVKYLELEFPEWYNYENHFIYGYFETCEKIYKNKFGFYCDGSDTTTITNSLENLISKKIDCFYATKINKIVSIIFSVIKLYYYFLTKIVWNKWERNNCCQELFQYIQSKRNNSKSNFFWETIYLIFLPLKQKITIIKLYLKCE